MSGKSGDVAVAAESSVFLYTINLIPVTSCDVEDRLTMADDLNGYLNEFISFDIYSDSGESLDVGHMFGLLSCKSHQCRLHGERHLPAGRGKW